MRFFVPGVESGHVHFFGTFDKFIRLPMRYPEWTHEIAKRAGLQNEQYLELMITPECHNCGPLIQKITEKSANELAKKDSVLMQWDFNQDVSNAQKTLKEIEEKRLILANCDNEMKDASCEVEVRYLFQALRGLPKEVVFSQLAFAFKLIDAEAKSPTPLMLGLNFVMPEDSFYSMQDYTEHMKMIGFLKNQYPDVHISLHAGELTLGLVPPEDLRSHIRQAMEQGKAERIGHGLSIIHEENHQALLEKMAKERILVEVALSSADEILEADGEAHPFDLYKEKRVPVALSTDDEGILRIDLTHEYQRAVESYDLSYVDLKEFVRNVIEYSFLPGDSLWQKGNYKQLISACADNLPGSKKPTAICQRFLEKNPKAKQQWELEKRFQTFEAYFNSV